MDIKDCQVFTSNQTYGIMAHVYRIFILQQINVEKKGFHSLTDWQIGISYHVDLLSKFIYFVRIRSKTAIH